MGVEEDFKKLRELMLLEEFKNCLPSEIKTYVYRRTENSYTMPGSSAI